MPDPNLPLLEDAVHKLAPFLGPLINDKAAVPIRGTNDVDVIAEIVTYADYIAFSERLCEAVIKSCARVGTKLLHCKESPESNCPAKSRHGLAQIAVSTLLRTPSTESAELCPRSTVDTALGILHQLESSGDNARRAPARACLPPTPVQD